MEKKKEQAKVLSQEMLADGIYSLWIETEAARTARPGQFVSVYTAVKHRQVTEDHIPYRCWQCKDC